MTWTFYNAQGQEKRATVSAPTSVPIENWHIIGAAGEPAFAAGVSAYGGGFATPAFRKYPDGTVELSGLINHASATRPLLLFQLPAGYWPVLAPGQTQTTIYEKDAAGLFAEVRISTNGSVYLNLGTTGYISLDGIRFSSGQATWPTGPPGPRGGSKWWTSGVTYGGVLTNNPADVVGAVQGDVFFYPDSGDTFSYDGSTWVYTGPLPVGGVEPYSFGLPPSSAAVDGQVVHFMDATMRAASHRWSFAYRAEVDRWEFIGGTPYYLENDAVFTTVATHSTYQDVGMGFTLPYAGVYIIEISGLLTTAPTAGNAAIFSVRFGATGAQDLWAAHLSTAAAVAVSSSVYSRVKLALAGTQLDPQLQLRSSATGVGAVSAQRKRFSCTPVYLNGV